MTEELEKCPFCGSGAVSIAILFEDTGNLFYGTCVACDASSKACETEQEATEEWNTRSKPTITDDMVTRAANAICIIVMDELPNNPEHLNTSKQIAKAALQAALGGE